MKYTETDSHQMNISPWPRTPCPHFLRRLDIRFEDRIFVQLLFETMVAIGLAVLLATPARLLLAHDFPAARAPMPKARLTARGRLLGVRQHVVRRLPHVVRPIRIAHDVAQDIDLKKVHAFRTKAKRLEKILENLRTVFLFDCDGERHDKEASDVGIMRKQLADGHGKSTYGQYLKNLV